MREKLKRKHIQILVYLLIIFAISLVPLSYYSLNYIESRIALITSIGLLLSIGIINEFKGQYFGRKTTYIVLFGFSVIFLLWRTNSFSANFLQTQINSEVFNYAREYIKDGSIIFDSTHSYFPMLALVTAFLKVVCGIPYSLIVYVNVGFYLSLVILLAFLVFQLIKSQVAGIQKNKKIISLLPVIIAFAVVSFANSSRGNVALVLTFLVTWFIYSKGFKNKSDAIVLMVAIAGITLGSNTTGALFLIPFFFLLPLFKRNLKTKILYGIIPLSYIIFCAYSYSVSLVRYTSFAWDGFVNFINGISVGEAPARVLPWQRSTLSSLSDTYMTSIANIALLLLALLIAILSVYTIMKKKDVDHNKDINTFYASALACLWLLLIVATITYIGASTMQETSMSDIRTIAIVFITIPLPFLFGRRLLIEKISSTKLLVGFLILLTIFASFFTVFQIYPKSNDDPINSVEDGRLETVSQYYAGDFITRYVSPGTIVLDYKILIANTPKLDNYTIELLSNSTFTQNLITSNSIGLQNRVISFDTNGLTFGSPYIAPDVYNKAYNLTISQNLVYNDGKNIVIVK
jgi:hypothetical protein